MYMSNGLKKLLCTVAKGVMPSKSRCLRHVMIPNTFTSVSVNNAFPTRNLFGLDTEDFENCLEMSRGKFYVFT